MSDDRSVSNRDRERAEAQRANLYRGGKVLVPQRSSNLPAPQPAFSQLMDRMQQDQPDSLAFANQSQSQATQTPVQAPPPREEHSGNSQENRRRSRDREPDRTDSHSKVSDSGKTKVKIAEERVIAKSPLSDRQGKGEGKNEQGNKGSNPWQGNRSSTVEYMQNLQSLHKGKIQELGQKTYLSQLKAAELIAKEKAKTPTLFSKTLLDQIVQYVRIHSKVDGEKEMDVSLHEKIFKGLRLKVATVRSKIEATFMTKSEEVHSLFLSHRSDIEAALKEKGIEVRRINVIMI